MGVSSKSEDCKMMSFLGAESVPMMKEQVCVSNGKYLKVISQPILTLEYQVIVACGMLSLTVKKLSWVCSVIPMAENVSKKLVLVNT